ncbi:MAG TPA: protein-glutamate O-methyltransferase CheR [Gemmatimonadales bacterium]|jgi:chemotaxis protein methyltransferase CheR
MTVAAHSERALGAAAEAIRRLTGLVFPESRRPALWRAIDNGMRRAATTNLEDYLERLPAQTDLLDALAAEVTVGESYFFRDTAQLAHLADEILTPLTVHRPDRPLRIWSAGCATGEEPYSLAIAMWQCGLLSRAHILGTDLSRAALAQARRARYRRWSLRGVAPEIIGRCFLESHDSFELRGDIQGAVDFRYLNLAEDTYPSLASGVWGMDVIICRNVLIYFDLDTVTRVVTHLLDSLGEDGWLVLGASDPLIADRVRCETEVTPAGLVYRRAGAKAATPITPTLPITAPKSASSATVSVAAHLAPLAPRPLPDAQAAADPSTPDATVARSAEMDAIAAVRALAGAGRLDEAGHACAAALDTNRMSAELHYLHAVLLAEAGHGPEAVTAARRALYLDRGLIVAHIIIGIALARSGDWRGARASLERAELALALMAREAIVPAADGEPAGRLADMVRVEMALIENESPVIPMARNGTTGMSL